MTSTNNRPSLNGLTRFYKAIINPVLGIWSKLRNINPLIIVLLNITLWSIIGLFLVLN